MKIAFYLGRKADNPKSKLFDWLVCAWTKSRYSHCELVIDGVCYSSSKRDGGVRGKVIDLNSGHWHVFDLNRDSEKALDWFYAHFGRSYDVAGLLGFVLPWRTHDPDRWFCSEACAAALKIPKHWTLSPGDLFNYLDRESGFFMPGDNDEQNAVD